MMRRILLPLLCLAAAPPAVITGERTKVTEPPPHGRIGMSTAWRYSDTVPNRTMEFRKRALHVGAAIGLHVIDHDEVYYVLSGRGTVSSAGKETPVKAGDSVYFYKDDNVGIWQKGGEPLVLIIAYPLPR